MRGPLRLVAVLALLLALLVVALHPPRVTHLAFHNAACLCPLCLITDGPLEVSWGEYC